MPNEDVVSILRLIWPVVILQVAVAIWAIVDITRRKNTRNLSPMIWILIVLFVNLLGPVAYFLFGRVEE